MAQAEQDSKIQLADFVDALEGSFDDEADTEEENRARSMLRQLSEDPNEASRGPAYDRTGPAYDRLPGERTATAFWRCCHEQGLTAFCDALTFSGLRDELPRLAADAGITVLAPTNDAFASLSETARADKRVVSNLLLGHICPGISSLEDFKAKNCAVAVAGQTHAVYTEESSTYVGTGQLSRTDIVFDGGVIHEVATCLMVLSLVQDSHSEQVWKKSLQPSPRLSALGGLSTLGTEFEVHGCLLHAATGQLVPEGLRNHTRPVKPVNEEQELTFGDITVMAKPPSLAKRRGTSGAPDGANKYRLLFSIWNTSSLSYISWQHMATPLVVRNSFHMLPIEEKNYRRQQYARARGQHKEDGGSSSSMLPTLPEGEASAPLERGMVPSPPPLERRTTEQEAASLPLNELGQLCGGSPPPLEGGAATLPPDWLPLGKVPSERLPDASQSFRSARQESIVSSEDQESISRDYSETRESVGNEPMWLHMAGPATMGAMPTMAGMSSDDAMVDAPAPWAASAGTSFAETTAMEDAAAHAKQKRPSFGPTIRKEPSFGKDPPSGSSGRPGLRPPPLVSSDSGSTSGGASGGSARLVDASCHESTDAGGIAVWLHGVDLPSDPIVRFGGTAVDPSYVQYISRELIKCIAPPFEPIGEQRHEVTITIDSSATSTQVQGAIPFTYVTSSTAAVDGAASHQAPRELLSRLIAALERSQAAVAAAVAQADDTQEAALHASGYSELGVSAFRMVDEHGFSLEMYTDELKRNLGASRPAHIASDLQQQHLEMAYNQKRSRLSASLELRPSIDALRKLNVLPDPEHASLRRGLSQKLSNHIPNRPAVEQLQDRNILHDADADRRQQEHFAKKSKLEQHLAERPTPEELHAYLGPSDRAPPALQLTNSTQLALDTLDSLLEMSEDDPALQVLRDSPT